MPEIEINEKIAIQLNDYEFGYVQEIMMKKNISLEDSIIYACG